MTEGRLIDTQRLGRLNGAAEEHLWLRLSDDALQDMDPKAEHLCIKAGVGPQSASRPAWALLWVLCDVEYDVLNEAFAQGNHVVTEISRPGKIGAAWLQVERQEWDQGLAVILEWAAQEAAWAAAKALREKM